MGTAENQPEESGNEASPPLCGGQARKAQHICHTIIVRAYMKRAFQKDLVQPEFKKAKKLSQLKEEPEENFTYEPIVDVKLDGYVQKAVQ